MTVDVCASTNPASRRDRCQNGVRIIGCLAGSIQPASAGLSPERPISQCTNGLEASAGLPQASVQTVLQTRDGYIWMEYWKRASFVSTVNGSVFNRSNTGTAR
jgi:ligand-binding sensor domain-containing protein